MRIYMKEFHASFHPDRIWNYFLEYVALKKNKKNKVSSDIGPVGYLIQQCKRSSDRLKFSMNVWLFDCSTYPVYSRCDLLAWFEIQELSPSGE